MIRTTGSQAERAIVGDAGSYAERGPLNIGDRFLKFEIRALLGKGGHAWVYHGYDAFLDRHVAIKIIPKAAEPGRDLSQRAQNEARVLCRIEDPNVVRVTDGGATDDGAIFIVMELLGGRTLRDVIVRFGRLNVVEAFTLGAKIASGVRAAHLVGAIHRDLKPENVFVVQHNGSNGIKVLDFGIAKLFGYGAATTQRDLVHGTMRYMSPEHLMGLGVTERSDIYALGTVLYEALWGTVPCLVGMQEPSRDALIFAQLHRMPPLLDELLPSVPRFLARTIHRMLAKAAQDRFATMAEVVEVLRAQLNRYLQESKASVPAARELWRATPALVTAPNATDATDAMDATHTTRARPATTAKPTSAADATTEHYQLSDLVPATAPPVTLPTRSDSDKVSTTRQSKPPFAELGTSTAPARGPAPDAVPLLPGMTPHIEARSPLSQARLRSGPSQTAPAPSIPVTRRAGPAQGKAVRLGAPPGHTGGPRNRTLVYLGIGLGTALGLLVAALDPWPPPASAPPSNALLAPTLARTSPLAEPSSARAVPATQPAAVASPTEPAAPTLAPSEAQTPPNTPAPSVPHQLTAPTSRPHSAPTAGTVAGALGAVEKKATPTPSVPPSPSAAASTEPPATPAIKRAIF